MEGVHEDVGEGVSDTEDVEVKEAPWEGEEVGVGVFVVALLWVTLGVGVLVGVPLVVALPVGVGEGVGVGEIHTEGGSHVDTALPIESQRAPVEAETGTPTA